MAPFFFVVNSVIQSFTIKFEYDPALHIEVCLE